MENIVLENSALEKAVYILDSYGLIYRAYFALISHPLTNAAGENISALTIFFKNLKALISKNHPAFLAAAFDSRVPTFRHEMYAEYKATRQKTPDDLHAQVPWIEEILEAMKIPVLRVDGFEADDVIATVAKKCAEENRPCRILSADKDLLQLVTDTCLEMQPDKFNGGWECVGVDDVRAKWGIGPEKILDYLSLVGDSADNVPGVKGVGDKTALKLLGEYGTLDGIYEHASEIKGALGEKIRGDRDNAYFSKKLISLREDVPLEIDFDSMRTDNLDFGSAGKLLMDRGAFSVAKSFLEIGGVSKDAADGMDAAAKNETSRIASPDDELRPEVKKNQGNYKPCTSLRELTSFVDSILSSAEKTVAFDTETDGLNPFAANLVGFSLSTECGSGIYVPVILPGGMFAIDVIDKKESLSQLARIFECPDVTVAMHNAKFDLHVLYAAGYTKRLSCRLVDTMVAAWLLNPDALGKSPYGLEYLGETVLGLKGIEFNDVVPKGHTFADVELDAAYPYAAEDADFTLQLWKKYEAKLKEKNLEELYFGLEMKVLPILSEMETRGIHLDKKSLADYSVELSEQIKAREQEIYSLAGHEFNIASTKQLQTVLFEERGLVPGKKTKTGYSTDNEVLEELVQRTTDPMPSAILEYRGATKLQSTYVETLPALADSNGRVHTSFLQTGTATGRLSSRDPNLQNIPVRDDAGRKIRSAFTAVPGTVLISADYAQIELVILAHLSGDPNLCSAFTQGVDVHKSTASLIYGIKPEDVTAEMRRFAKTVNFGVMYGMSAFRLASDLGISRTEAKNFIDQYFTTYSDVKKFLNSTVDSARQNGFVETISGRRRFIRGINSKNKIEQNAAERIAVNTPIQGSAADIVKRAMVEVQSAIEADSDLNGHLRMLLQVHDELIFECDDTDGLPEKATALIRDKMENVIKLRVPLRVSIESGNNWGAFH
ncbi:MAG: DNA polymerase I [Treponema sp.]|nr:DNA polymerase I [Treponema sp.]